MTFEGNFISVSICLIHIDAYWRNDISPLGSVLCPHKIAYCYVYGRRERGEDLGKQTNGDRIEKNRYRNGMGERGHIMQVVNAL